jgi:preprotein translocase subunit SecF
MKIRFGNVEFFPPGWHFDFMKFKKYSIGMSVILTIAAIAIIGIRGINYSIDFLGGSEVALEVRKAGANRGDLVSVAEKAGVGSAEVTTYGALADRGEKNEFLLRLQHEKGRPEAETTARVDTVIAALRKEFGADAVLVKSVSNISGKIGAEEERKGYMALLFACVGILIYIAFRFDPRFGPGAIICLVHDVIIAVGFMTALGKPFSTSSIAAFLTIIGYSINDTVIVYDRIREVQSIHPRMSISEVINTSISQTMNRTVLTASSGLAGLLVLATIGGGAIEDFAITMFIGIVVGTFSSIYVAAPLTIVMENWLRKTGWKPKDPSLKAKVAKDPNYIPPVVLKKRKG